MRLEKIQQIPILPIIPWDQQPTESQCIFSAFIGYYGYYYQVTHTNHPFYGEVYFLVVVGGLYDFALDLVREISLRLFLPKRFEDISTSHVSKFILYPKR